MPLHKVFRPEELAPQATADGGEQVEHGVRVVLPGDHSSSTSQVVERSSPKNSSPPWHSPPRPQRSFPATDTSPG